MKMKLAFAIVAGLLISSNTFAVEVYKGHVLSHKEWSSNNIKYSFADAKNRRVFSPKAIQAKDNDSSQIGMASMADTLTGSVGSPVTTTGSVSATISNNTATTQTYQYFAQSCVQADDKHGRCAFYQDTVSLDAGGYALYDIAPTMQLTFDTAGFYDDEIATSVSGSDRSFSSSVATGTIQIS